MLSDYFDAINSLPAIVHADSTGDEFAWFKLGYLLGAQAGVLEKSSGVRPIIATTNVKHLERMADARKWRDVAGCRGSGQAAHSFM